MKMFNDSFNPKSEHCDRLLSATDDTVNRRDSAANWFVSATGLFQTRLPHLAVHVITSPRHRQTPSRVYIGLSAVDVVGSSHRVVDRCVSPRYSTQAPAGHPVLDHPVRDITTGRIPFFSCMVMGRRVAPATNQRWRASGGEAPVNRRSLNCRQTRKV